MVRVRTIINRILGFILSVSMVIPAGAVYAGDNDEVQTTEEISVPVPLYEFTFDGNITDNRVENDGSKEDVTAYIEGDGPGLGVIYDEQRGNNVLNLPGGKVGAGRLTLPAGMFDIVGNEGFTFSYWIDIDESANQYSRIFSAAINGQNSSDGDNWAFNEPEFTFVAGDDNAADLGYGQAGYHTSVMLPDKSTQMKLVWTKSFVKGQWQHVTISVSYDSYDVYLDGEKVAIKYDRNNNMDIVLSRLFANNAEVLKRYRYCGIGPSVYTTDNDLKARIDEFRFYDTALTAEQVYAAYHSYDVDSNLIAALKDKIYEARSKRISFYTKESYEELNSAITEGEKGIKNPVTDANINRLILKLDMAIKNLIFYPGITEYTEFSNAQLREEIETAQVMLSGGELSSASEKQISDALIDAAAALSLENTAENQAAVDDALYKLRTAMENVSYGAMLHFDASKEHSTGKLLHGSTGFLYGVSEPGVPSANLIQAISPKILVQKAADGKQHPSGDAYRLTPFLCECGVENIQVYIQDYYLEWPYEYNGIDDYNEKVKTVVTKMVKGKSKEELSHYSFVLFNEPDGIWYSKSGGKTIDDFCRDWLTIYTTVKSIDSDLKVAGPNYSLYNSSDYKTFFEFCKRNNCLPEYITWHELQKDRLGSFAERCDEVRNYINTYYAGSKIEPDIFINETVNFSDLGNPGALVNWLSVFEEQNVYASLPFWGLANSLNELAADTNKPNGAWWVYKWYAQMSGDKMPLVLENTEPTGAYGGLYGLASADDEAGVIYSLFGGQAGKQTISIENIRSMQTFKNVKNACVKIYKTKYTGQQGFADTTPLQFEGNLAFAGNDLIFTIPDAELNDAYFAVIMPAKNDTNTTIKDYRKNWEETYEAEDARLIGSAEKYEQTGDGTLARSGRYDVGHMNTENDGVEFTVNVPDSGRYRLNIYYSSQAPQVDPLTLKYVETGGQNRAIGALSRHLLSIDGGPKQEIVYDSTVKWGYYNYKTVYTYLSAGSHKILLMYKGDDQNVKELNSMLCATLDKIDLTYEPYENAEITIGKEEFIKEDEETGGYDFYVCAPCDGYYKTTVLGSGNAVISKYKVNYADSAKAEADISISRIELLDTGAGADNAGYIYLTAGINHLCICGSNLSVDKIIFTEDKEKTEESVILKEAENCGLSGTKKEDDYNYLPGSEAVPKVIETKYASGGKAVEGFRGGSDNKLVFNVDVPAAGDYVLSIGYSNNEPAPVMTTQNGSYYVHPYNTDLVERYVQVTVNDESVQTVYFRNTLCWDTYKNTVIDVVLKEGTNTITISNDNSYKFSSLQDDFTPRLDKFEIIPAKQAAVKPAATESPEPTGQPGETMVPELTDKPDVTAAPESTDKPDVTAAPGSADQSVDNNVSMSDNMLGHSGTASGNDTNNESDMTKKLSRIKILKVEAAKKNTLTVKWKKNKTADGYQIQYALNKKFSRTLKTISIKKKKAVKRKIRRLKAGRKYYIRIRAYKISGRTRVYGKWSKIAVRRCRG